MKEIRPKRYHSVSIVCPRKSCAAVEALVGKRFFATDAPSLPVPNCTLSSQCKCSFQKHSDRRDDERRFAGTVSQWYGGAEKRRPRERRQRG
jgi:hypothetical protein